MTGEQPPFVMVRSALLGVAEAMRMVETDTLDDPVAAAAIMLAAGPRVLAARDEGRERARTTVARYLARMGGRATPYGAFAGVATADVGPRRQLAVGERSGHRVRVRVDVEALDGAVREGLDEVGLPRWPVRANHTARIEGDEVRYHRCGDASADVVTIRATAPITAVLTLLGHGTLLGAVLVDHLAASAPSIPRESFSAFLARLVDTGLLYRAVDLVAPGVEPVELAVSLLRGAGDDGRADALAALAAAVGGEQVLDEHLPARLDAAWTEAAHRIAAFADVDDGHRFHVELELDLAARTLDRRTVDDLELAMRRVRAFADSGGNRRDGVLDELKAAFRARYEDAEVPLLAAFDLETGVRPAPNRGLSQVAGSAGVHREEAQEALRVHPARLRILDRWLRHGGPVDLADLPDDLPVPERSGARSVQAVLLGGADGESDGGPDGCTSMLVGGAGRPPLALMARFCAGRGELQRAALDWAAAATAGSGDAVAPHDRPIVAELVHNPGGRIANVLVRPRISEDTVALGGAAGGTIGLDRLLVRLQGDELRLRDARTGRPVVIALNTAHNVDMAGQDPLYSVLGHLSSPGGVAWSWGGLRTLPHLPRVTCGRVIVAPEQWCLQGADVRSVLAAPDAAARLRELLPGIGSRRFVGTGVFDHILPMDLTSARSVTVALARAAGGDDVEVVEMPQLERPAAAGAGGGHVTEAVIALPAPLPRPDRSRPATAFDPAHGASWVYFKYYTGPAAADAVAAHAQRLAAQLRDEGSATAWFFLRYQDEGHHVRVRMRPADAAARGRVVAEMGELGGRLRRAGLVSRTVMDDYVPEVSRYGGTAGLQVAERLFDADSDAVARLVADAPDEQARLRRGVADTLTWCSVGFDEASHGPDAPTAREEFLQLCGGVLGLSFPASGNPHGKLFREQRPALDAYLASAATDPRTTAQLGALAATVRHLDEGHYRSVLGSALHLHCNRLFAFDANRMEFLCYELARRKLRERRARAA